MIKQDYVSRLIKQFSERVSITLNTALIKENPEGIGETEEAIGALLELDPNTLFALEPESFVLMVTLGGTGEMVSRHVAYALNKLADAYTKQAQKASNKVAKKSLQDVANLRRAQASALLASFGITSQEVPEELKKINQAIKDAE